MCVASRAILIQKSMPVLMCVRDLVLWLAFSCLFLCGLHLRGWATLLEVERRDP